MRRITILIITLLFLSNLLFAQKLTLGDFKEVSAKIRSMKRYGYTTTMTGIFPNGQKDELVTTTFMDLEKKNYAYKNKIEQVILNSTWFYRANHSGKSVSVFDVNKYKARYKGEQGNLAAIFNSSLSADFLDSLVVKEGKLKVAKKEGSVSIFEFEFAPQASLKSLIIKFDHSKGMLQSIFMHTVGEYGAGRRSEYKILCSGYSSTFSDAEFDTKNLFSVSGSKANLLKYKNYKVSSIL